VVVAGVFEIDYVNPELETIECVLGGGLGVQVKLLGQRTQARKSLKLTILAKASFLITI
jgi:hypothetical protein